MTEALRDRTLDGASAEDLDHLLTWLQRWVRNSLGASEADAADVAQDTVIALLERALTAHGIDEIRNPAAYVTWLARNRMIDRIRMRSREMPEPMDLLLADHALDDQGIVRLIDSAASTADVEAAMRNAVLSEDLLVVRVVTIWLDEAARRGQAPSSREVAAKAGLSHTSVNQALRRFRGYFPNRRSHTSTE